ncbi:histidine ABC transporter substrate-binding protein HisJ [Salmonella bongori]|nr:histidine ABC transporter substrate-binding protein HisJ [Salmonella bongori]
MKKLALSLSLVLAFSSATAAFAAIRKRFVSVLIRLTRRLN